MKTEVEPNRNFTTKSLLKDYPDIKRWHRRMSKLTKNEAGEIVPRAKLTADTYVRRMALYCRTMQIDPMEMLEDPKAGKTLKDYCFDQCDRGLKASYVVGAEKAVKSWFSFNDIPLNVKISTEGKFRGYKEVAPDQEELGRILRDSDKRARAIIGFLAFTGVRPQVLGSYRSERGLVLGDLKDLKLPELEFENMPAMIAIREELSKTGMEYLSFLPKEGCEYLKEYLMERVANGEVLTSESPLFIYKMRGKHLKNNGRDFLTTTTVSFWVRKSFQRAGFEGRPYVLRTYFATNTLIAVQKRQMTSETRSFLIGHKGDMDRRYAEGRGNANLSRDLIEEMRNQYRDSQEWLITHFSKVNQQEIMADVHRRVIIAEVMMAMTVEEEKAEEIIIENKLLEISLDERMAFYQSRKVKQVHEETCYCCFGDRFQTDNRGIRLPCPACEGKGKITVT